MIVWERVLLYFGITRLLSPPKDCSGQASSCDQRSGYSSASTSSHRQSQPAQVSLLATTRFLRSIDKWYFGGLKMSSLRNAVKRRTHKERAQPTARSKFGLLEKHKDYVARAQNYHKKQEVIQKLREKAASRNPDEFYFKMINTKSVDGVHRPESTAKQYSQEEQQMIETQNIGYWAQKAQSEKKKVERLSAVLHSTSHKPENKHIYFAEDREEANVLIEEHQGKARKNNADKIPKRIKRKIGQAYKELEERKNRATELQNVVMKYSMQKELMGKGRKRKLRDDEMSVPTTEPVYKWRKERKR